MPEAFFCGEKLSYEQIVYLVDIRAVRRCVAITGTQIFIAHAITRSVGIAGNPSR